MGFIVERGNVVSTLIARRNFGPVENVYLAARTADASVDVILRSVNMSQLAPYLDMHAITADAPSAIFAISFATLIRELDTIDTNLTAGDFISILMKRNIISSD